MHKRSTLCVVFFSFLAALLLCVPPVGAQQTKKPTPASAPAKAPAEEKAGAVTAELPRGQIARKADTLVAKIGEEIFWNDIVQTSDKGRMRITLLDTTVLNIGPQATFRVVTHNQKTQQSELYLIAGKMRARVKKGSDDKQKFSVKTDAAVLGVIGTDFFVAAASEETTVTVYEGAVRVRSSDPDVAGEQRVNAGQTLTIRKGEPPPPPRPAPLQELEDSLRDTDVGPALPTPPAVETARRSSPAASPAASTPPRPAAPAGGGDTWKSGWQAFGQGFSADMVITTSGQQMRMKTYMRGQDYRMEMNQQGQQIISILRPSRGVMWTLMPDQQMYMEVSLAGMPAAAAQTGFADAMRDSGAQAQTEMLGIEQVGPYTCQKFRYRTIHKGQTYSGLSWLAPELGGFPVKVVDETSGSVIEYQNIRLGPPDASLFEVPPGYRKMSY